MKRLITLLAVVLGVSACTKTESLRIILANAYDHTVLVSGNGSELSIKSGKIAVISMHASGGFGNPLDVHAAWKSSFYDKYETLTISSEDHTVLDTWTKDDSREGNPFDVGNWSHDEDSGIQNALDWKGSHKMNIYIIIAFVLGAGTIFANKVRELPHWLAIVLYTAAVALFVIGMIVSREAGY